MSPDDRNELLVYSKHPFWRDAVFQLYEKNKSTKSDSILRRERVELFLQDQREKFKLSIATNARIVGQIQDLVDLFNNIAHNPGRYRPIGEIIIRGEEKIPPEMEQAFQGFSDGIRSFADLMENFKLKPIGILDQLDEIIEE